MTDHKRTFKTMVAVIACVALPIAGLIGVYDFNNRPPHIKIPTHSVPKDNGWDYFVRAGEIMGKSHHFGPMSDPDTKHVWTLPEYQSFIRDNAPAFVEMREGLKRPFVAPRLTVEDVINMYGGFREEGRMLSSEAQYYEFIHEPGKAMDSHLDCIEFGVKFAKGGGLTHDLVAIAITEIGMSRAEQALSKMSRHDLDRTAEKLVKVQSEWVPYSEIVLEEGCQTTSMCQLTFQDRTSFGSPKNWFDVDPVSGKRSPWTMARLAFSNKTAIVRETLRYHEELAREQTGFYTGKSQVPELRNAYADYVGAQPGIIMEGRKIHERVLASITVLQAEIALLRYRDDNGQYPANLGQLTPKYLKSISIDPFGRGKSLRYKLLSPNKFLLYSIGMNLVDDGGKPGRWDSGDIVAGQLDPKWP